MKGLIAEVARECEVTYNTAWRWFNRGVTPSPRCRKILEARFSLTFPLNPVHPVR